MTTDVIREEHWQRYAKLETRHEDVHVFIGFFILSAILEEELLSLSHLEFFKCAKLA